MGGEDAAGGGRGHRVTRGRCVSGVTSALCALVIGRALSALGVRCALGVSGIFASCILSCSRIVSHRKSQARMKVDTSQLGGRSFWCWSSSWQEGLHCDGVAETSTRETKHHTRRVEELRFITLAGPEELTLQALSYKQRDYRVFIDRLYWTTLAVICWFKLGGFMRTCRNSGQDGEGDA